MSLVFDITTSASILCTTEGGTESPFWLSTNAHVYTYRNYNTANILRAFLAKGVPSYSLCARAL